MNYNNLSMAELIKVRKSVKKEIQVLENKKVALVPCHICIYWNKQSGCKHFHGIDQITSLIKTKTDQLNEINTALKPLLDQDTKNLLK